MIAHTFGTGFGETHTWHAPADADLNGDGVVNFVDLSILKQRFFKPPGPSGLHP